jgi:hypothetical protein
MAKPIDLIAQISGNLAAATPVQIDTVLAWFYEATGITEHRAERQAEIVDTLDAQSQKVLKGETVRGLTTAADGIRHQIKLQAAATATLKWMDELKALEVEMAPFQAEYEARRWSRYFQVQGDTGHIHRSMTCQTCNRESKRTRFNWLVEFSGKAETELTDEVGPTACTVCFPWAETIRVEHEAQLRAERAAAREAERAERARIAAEKGITTPEGAPVNIGRHSYRDIAKTLRTAQAAATDFLYDLIREKQHSVDPEYAWMYESGRTTTEKNQAELTYSAWHVLRSIAFKTGRTFEETFQEHEKKAQAKIRKADREWAKDPRNPNRVK